MKLALVLYYQNEAHWLKLHLPYVALHFDVLVAVDGGSHDGSRFIVERWGGHVYERPFNNDHAAQMNFALDMAQKHGATHALRLDPDEVIADCHFNKIRRLLQTHDALFFPRITFEADRDHVWHEVYPDWQPRAHKIDVRWSGKVHESPLPDIHAKGYSIAYAPEIAIHHYEGLHSPAYKAMKHVNYKRIETGEPLLTRYDAPAQHRHRVSYAGGHPIETETKRAPLPDFDICPYQRDETRVWVRNDVDRAVLDQVQTEYDWTKITGLDRVIDIGGHAGYFSVEVKRRNPKARISVIEVEPANVALLRFHLGHWADVDLHLARCGYDQGDYVLAFNRLSNSSHRVIKRDSFVHDHFRDQPLDAPLIRLEELTPDNEPVDLLKLDCEGSEIDILLNVSDEWLSRVKMIIGERHVTMQEFAAVDERLSKLFDVEHTPKVGFEYLGWFVARRK